MVFSPFTLEVNGLSQRINGLEKYFFAASPPFQRPVKVSFSPQGQSQKFPEKITTV
jgi:hypothetical protein